MVISEDQAKELQIAIEKTFRKKLSFDIRSGDIVLGEFTNLPNVGKAKRVCKFVVKSFFSNENSMDF